MQSSDLPLTVDRPICEAQAHVLGLVDPKLRTGYTSRRTGDTVAYRPRFLGLPIVWVAAVALVVGLAYAAISAYWAFGGTWLLTTVSSSLVTAHQSATVMMAVWAAVVLKAVGALLPFYVCLPAPPSNRHGRLRLLAWTEGAVLTLYGFAFTVAGLLVQAGVVHREGAPTSGP